MELKFYLSTLWKWSWLIVLSTMVATVSSFWATTRMPRIYSTSTTLMVGRFTQTADPTGQDFYISQQLAQSYLELIRRQPVLQGAIDTLSLDIPWQVLAGQVSATLVPGTQLIQITVQDTDPARAKTLADEMAQQLIRQSPTPVEQDQSQHRQFVSQRLGTLQAQIQEAEQQIKELEQRLALENSARGIQDIQNQIETLQQKVSTWQSNYADLLNFYEGSRTNYLSVVEQATVPTTPVSPRVEYFLLLAAAIGFSLAAGAAFLLEYLDDTLKTKEDVERVLKLSTLGTITRVPKVRQPSDSLVMLQANYIPITEAYRMLRTNLQFATLNQPLPKILVTSASPGEGKTTTACNLAITIAYGGKPVILVDADLRRPSLHRVFDLSNQVGLTSLLLDESLPVEAALVDAAVPGLRLLPSGPLPPNPADILNSEPMQQRLAQLQALAGVIIFDTPPILAVADTVILGPLCSGVILVVDAGQTRCEVVRRAKETLEQVNLKIFGVVLNKLSTRQAKGYYHYDYYSHASSRGRPKQSKKTTQIHRSALWGQLTQPPTHQAAGNGHGPAIDVVEEEEKRT